jgi:SAM-dependent methyltransferase
MASRSGWRRAAWVALGLLVLAGGGLVARDLLHWDREWITDEKLRWLAPDNPVRSARCDTPLFLEAVDPRPGQVVADIGAGGGFFAFRLAERVGPSGRVYATEATDPLPAVIERWARDHGVPNVVVVKTEVEEPGLPEPVDTVAMFNLHSFCEAGPTRAFFGALRPSVRSGGRVVFFTDIDRETSPGTTCQLPLAGMEAALEGLFRLQRQQPYAPDCPPDAAGRATGYLAVWEPLPAGDASGRERTPGP